jgi:hypothetical protein
MQLTGVFNQFSEDKIEVLNLNASHVCSIIQVINLTEPNAKWALKLFVATMPQLIERILQNAIAADIQ